MASTDAKPLPIKNTAYRITFPIFDADGDLVTGATALDSEVSLDGGTFADCTNEATEIATASGMYYLDLTAAEMNADTVSVIIKTTSSGAKTTPIVLYPATGNINNLDAAITSRLASGTIAADVTAILADTGTDGVKTLLIDQDYIETGTAQSGTANTITLAAGAASTNDLWVGQQISIYEGTGAGQTRGVLNYNGSTKVLTVARNWKTNPDATSKYKIHLFFGPKVNNTLEVTVADAGVDLTAIPWNAAWDAEIQSECADALTAYAPALASVCTETRLAELDGANLPTDIDFVKKWINNKLVESPAGTWKLYDDDNTTVLKTWTWDSGTSTRSKAT